MDEELTDIYEQMLGELEGQGLEVCLTPAPRPAFRGHMVRTCYNMNPVWYRKLCDKYRSSRKRRNLCPDTRVKRRNVIRQLNLLIAGKKTNSYIANELRRIAQKVANEPF